MRRNPFQLLGMTVPSEYRVEQVDDSAVLNALLRLLNTQYEEYRASLPAEIRFPVLQTCVILQVASDHLKDLGIGVELLLSHMRGKYSQAVLKEGQTTEFFFQRAAGHECARCKMVRSFQEYNGIFYPDVCLRCAAVLKELNFPVHEDSPGFYLDSDPRILPGYYESQDKKTFVCTERFEALHWPPVLGDTVQGTFA